MEDRSQQSTTIRIASKDVVSTAAPLAPTGFIDYIEKDERTDNFLSNSSIFLESTTSLAQKSETDEDSSSQRALLRQMHQTKRNQVSSHSRRPASHSSNWVEIAVLGEESPLLILLKNFCHPSCELPYETL